ncbi:glutaredoxin domain-containing cysteine-rich protein CG12206 [Drosophila tropicalis]|uniref:glutaredoxin domain-containing cysteine-rich protein CG12206 n=1 Tax=Drosophila tropicalis TaxID=46794 RepID=UPI0035ABE04F
MAAATATSTTTTTAELDLRQRPLRGISIIIESAQPTTTATAVTTTTTTTVNNNNNAEMSLKSQANVADASGMLLAFGDNNNSSNIVDNLETSYQTTEASNITKTYPQLLLRIGQTEDQQGEIAAIATATATATAIPTPTTIISCNVGSDETEYSTSTQPTSNSGEMLDSSLTSQDVVVVAAKAHTTYESSPLSAVTETVATCTPQHTVKIQIANGQDHTTRRLGKQISVVKLNDSDMVLQQQQQQQIETTPTSVSPSSNYQLCYLVSSGQYSPCETLDSGTGSDLESIKSPTQEVNNVPKLQLHLKTTRIRVNDTNSNLNSNTNTNMNTNSNQRAYSLTDSEECCDENESSASSLSCDSLHSNEALPHTNGGKLLPRSLLRDIRDISTASSPATKIDGRPLQYEADQYYNFHVNEHENFRSFGGMTLPVYDSTGYGQDQNADNYDDESFGGYKDEAAPSLPSATIRSAKGTVRGVKNRVRNGVATFLQLQQPTVKNYMEKDLGKVVLYTTSMGIIRDTYAKCSNVKKILRTLLIKFEERDVFMSLEYQQEIRERMQDEKIRVPQLFVEGQLIGDADVVERMNENGELRQLLKPYKSIATAFTCQTCGGYRLLPCPSCSGSKKSVHRNHFTAEFVALKCMNCDEVGLVKCPNC